MAAHFYSTKRKCDMCYSNILKLIAVQSSFAFGKTGHTHKAHHFLLWFDSEISYSFPSSN